MFENLWNFLLGKKLSRFKDEVLTVCDILPAKLMANPQNDSHYFSCAPATNADNQTGVTDGGGAGDSENEMN